MLVTESKTILEVLLAVERLDEVVVVGGGGCTWFRRPLCNPRKELGRSTENLKFGDSQPDKQFVGV